MMKKSRKHNDSGRIWIENNYLNYVSRVYGAWTLDLRAIKAMGEHTNQNGPFADDYFFAFIVSPDEGWLDASFCADGREEVLNVLAQRFGPAVQCGLCSSTDFKSRIWWPTALAGEPMFEYRKAKGFWGRLGLMTEQWISPRLVEFLKTKDDEGRRAR